MATVATKTGKSVMAQRIKGEGSEPKFVCWGLNPNSLTAKVSDIALYEESGEAREEGTSSLQKTTIENDTYRVVGTLTASTTRLIREAGLTNSGTKPFSTTVAAGGTVPGGTGGTELKVAAGTSIANSNFIQVRDEVMEVTSGGTTTTLTVVRKANESTANSAITTGDAVTVGNIPGPYATAAKGAAITGGTVFTHADVGLVTLAAGDSIQWTWNVQFS